MQNRLFRFSIGRPPNRRITLVAIGLACLLALAAATAFLTGQEEHEAPANAPSPTRSPTSHTKDPAAKTGPVARPPRISDPVQYAKAAAEMLWTYDTRTTSHDQQLAGMKAWMTKESQYNDWASVSAQMPDPLLWSRMADQKQHAGATVAEAHYPAAFKQALAESPSEITKAYIYAVTVTGKQTITWSKHGGGAEERSIILAVQCRPSHACSLVAIAPRIAP
ncbi:hypothetical protein ACIQNI_28995 [Streptomyces sp. NPDC091266]|uniref:hypothetical protein n=1 Tax=Streptomyces sp. NPDC091266 TaxID=3365978 RepID=UPI00381A4E32